MNKNQNNQSISEKADQLLDSYQVHAKMDKEQVLGTILNNIEQAENSPVRKINWFRVAGISAAATIAVLIAFYFFTATVTISAGEENPLTHRLPDDSRVVLYKNSVAEFGRFFRKRKVKLEGEAYFEVVKGDGFEVKTQNGKVQVLGTRFLVSDKDNMLNVKCYQGKVQTDFNNKSWILEPGSQFTGNENSSSRSRFEKSVQYPEFALFFRNFSNTPLSVVIAELEEFFDVQINLQTGNSNNFSGTLQTGKLESALQIVCGSLQLEYEFEDDYEIKIF